ncbi:MAG: hypothetical protein O3A77_03430, partial [bacterium]|nr:hypothetical protein [bacterium]
MIVRKVTLDSGQITTVAGVQGQSVSNYNDSGENLATNTNIACPSHVQFDQFGNLYIVSWDQNRIYKLEGNTIIKVAGNGSGWKSISGMGGLAVNADNGSPLASVVDGSNDVYIGTWANRVLKKESESGIVDYFAGSGVNGSSLGDGSLLNSQFGSIYGMVIDDNSLYLMDNSNSRILKISGDFTPASVVNQAPEFTNIASTGVSNGSLYEYSPTVSDADGDSTSVTVVQKPGWLSEVYSYIYSLLPEDSRYSNTAYWDVGVDSAMNVYVTDYSGMKVKRYPASGGSPIEIPVAENPAGIVISPDDVVYVSTMGGTVYKIDAGANTATLYATLSGNTLRRIAMDSSGNLYVTNYGDKRVEKVDAQGNVTTYAQLSTYPHGIAIDDSDRVYVADRLGGILEILSDGTVTERVPKDFVDANGNNQSFVMPHDIAVHGGALYMVDSLADTFYAINTDTWSVSRWVGPG